MRASCSVLPAPPCGLREKLLATEVLLAQEPKRQIHDFVHGDIVNEAHVVRTALLQVLYAAYRALRA